MSTTQDTVDSALANIVTGPSMGVELLTAEEGEG